MPSDAHPYLDKQLDWDNGGVDKDLNEMAREMVEWEERLSTHLEMKHSEIQDIKATSKDSPVLQR